MIEWIIKYWVEVLFGLIIAAASFFFKKFWTMIKNEQEQQKKDFIEQIDSKFEAQNKKMDQKFEDQEKKIVSIIDDRDKRLIQEDKEAEERILSVQTNFTAMKDAMLSIQGRAFKEDCRKLLVADHEISLSEYENINSEHIIYNKLGGNHDGDALFDLVKTKYTQHLATSAGIKD